MGIASVVMNAKLSGLRPFREVLWRVSPGRWPGLGKSLALRAEEVDAAAQFLGSIGPYLGLASQAVKFRRIRDYPKSR